ncbi:MAG: hypothetical protein HXS48_13635 [Theionarchaea archaeon]|nr:hypothetical protein [Theionarchaea archaeon]
MERCEIARSIFCRFADEIEEKTKEYQYFVLKGIFPEYEQKNTKIALKI